MGCSSAVPVNTMMSMASHPVPIAANRDDRQAQRRECDLSGSPVSLVEVDRSTTNAAEAGTSASAVTDKPRTFDELVAFIRATMGKCGMH